MNDASVAGLTDITNPADITILGFESTKERPIRVMLVEPDAEAALTLRRHLLSAGPTVQLCHVSGALAGLRMLQTEPIDCVLLEPSLSDAAGLSACDAFLTHPTQLPVVVLTMLDVPDIALEAVKRGVQDWLIKSEASPRLITRALHFALARRNNELHLRSVRERLLDIAAEASFGASDTGESPYSGVTPDERLGFAVAELHSAIDAAKSVVDEVRGSLTVPFLT